MGLATTLSRRSAPATTNQTHCLGPFGQRADIATPSYSRPVAGFFIPGSGNHHRHAYLLNRPEGLTLFKQTQHPLTTRGESMYRMEKITTGAAYGASAGSILNGMLNAYSPEQWNAIGVLVGIIIAVLTYLTNLYFKIREDNRRSRSRDEPDAEE